MSRRLETILQNPVVLLAVLVVALALIIAPPLLWWSGNPQPDPTSKLMFWVFAMLGLTDFVAILGINITGRFLGVLIDDRNKMSLSRFQLLVWTIIIISGYSTAALWNVLATDASDPLAVRLPEELWWLLGISTASLVGSPLVLSTKKPNTPNEQELQKNNIAASVGQVAVNTTPEEAKLSDMFKGDETGNQPYLDLSKVQLFFFTIVVVIAYVSVLSTMLRTTTGVVEEFPALSESVLVLLGISHAGYLTYKGISHSAPSNAVMDIRQLQVARGIGQPSRRATGHMTLQDSTSNVMALDLYMDDDLTAHGFLTGGYPRSPAIIREVKLYVSRRVLNHIEDEVLSGIQRSSPDFAEALSTPLKDLREPLELRVAHDDYPELTLMIYRPDLRRKVWSGVISDTATGEDLSFFLHNPGTLPEGTGESQGQEEERSAALTPLSLAIIRWSVSRKGAQSVPFDQLDDECIDKGETECAKRRKEYVAHTLQVEWGMLAREHKVECRVECH
jgi:hypothetical protein